MRAKIPLDDELVLVVFEWVPGSPGCYVGVTTDGAPTVQQVSKAIALSRERGYVTDDHMWTPTPLAISMGKLLQ